MPNHKYDKKVSLQVFIYLSILVRYLKYGKKL